jgi:hypothetical protein
MTASIGAFLGTAEWTQLRTEESHLSHVLYVYPAYDFVPILAEEWSVYCHYVSCELLEKRVANSFRVL